ncbi:PLP-dependent aminotransferase family protein [Acetobacter sp.]|uniref:MocR-like pyridoxine biosynthesis transcription factor PdxR n=1 Tax=Acetobacter sp. TaxID=440 RepID=UPI0039E89589
MPRPVFLPTYTLPDPAHPETMPVQIYRDLLRAIRAGQIASGTKLPSSRKAADMLGVSRSTINDAYDLLRAEGVLHVNAGAAPEIVALQTGVKQQSIARNVMISHRGVTLASDVRSPGYAVSKGRMSPGVPDETLFPAAEWGQILRRVARQRHGDVCGYDEPFGIASLRECLAERLFSDRGVSVSSEQILITTGTQASLALIAQLLTDPGECAALEDPAYPGARTAFLGAGLKLAPVPVDEEGMIPEMVPEKARLIYLTPSNQYPLGTRLSFARRMQILEKARQTGVLVLEDDYDSEFLWRGREIAALAAYAQQDEVIYVGSAAKTLMPALRVGWMAVPPSLVAPLRIALRNLGMMAGLHAQLALAEAMRTGLYRAQLRRIAKTYEARGNALYHALTTLPDVRVRPPDGGVQLAVTFMRSGLENAAMGALARKGFRPARLSALCLAEKREGLVVGFADATDANIQSFREIMQRVLEQSGAR